MNLPKSLSNQNPYEKKEQSSYTVSESENPYYYRCSREKEEGKGTQKGSLLAHHFESSTFYLSLLDLFILTPKVHPASLALSALLSTMKLERFLGITQEHSTVRLSERLRTPFHLLSMMKLKKPKDCQEHQSSP